MNNNLDGKWPNIKQYVTKANLIASILFVLVVISMWLSEKFPDQKLYFDQFSSVVMISGIWTILYDIFLKKDFLYIVKNNMCLINNRINAFENIERTGLCHIESDANSFKFESFIQSNRKITILLNDGRTWISHNEQYFEKNDHEDTDIIFIITHPDSEMINILARKQNLTCEQIKIKIDEFIGSIKRINDKRQNKIKVFGHKLYNPNSIFLGESEVIMSSYLVARGRGCVPLYIYKNKGNESYYEQVKKDLNGIISDEDTEDLLTKYN
ncbi:hypothetical protein [Desulfovibrio sp. ZJ369]|uniref:hypothetical protein n=1 Tax=Desulfovibrio sp. ZJ369 TaxID=2709793 RepID=UPI0013EBEEB0|nr:hypothetical protein [Desulfovibrio sp. ZJ369]